MLNRTLLKSKFEILCKGNVAVPTVWGLLERTETLLVPLLATNPFPISQIYGRGGCILLEGDLGAYFPRSSRILFTAAPIEKLY